MTRKESMWNIIKEDMLFSGLTVVDFGSGNNELAIFAVEAGARVIAIDNNPKYNDETLKTIKRLVLLVADIDDMILPDGDVAFCFSVLPYLRHPIELLQGLSTKYRRTYIECQYDGDGPGPHFLKTDDDMAIWLGMWWDSCTPIGKTFVPGRDKHRTIWRCKGES